MEIKTIIELLDRRSLPNVVGTLSFSPEKVIYIADDKNEDREKEKRTEIFFGSKGIKVSAEWIFVDMSDYKKVYKVIKEAVERNDSVAIEVTGGRAYSYIAAGNVCREKGIPAIYYNFRRNKFYDVFTGKKLLGNAVSLNIEDMILLSGGKVRSNKHFSPSDADETMEKVIKVIGGEYFRNSENWSKFVTYMQKSVKYYGEQYLSGLTFESPLTITQNGVKYNCPRGMMNRLATAGAFVEYGIDEETKSVTYSFSSRRMKQLLTAYGDWLEMYTFMAAKKAGAFDDAQVSLEIDWNGTIGEEGDVYNEIDGVYLKGVRALFVSNKLSGDLRTDDIYEIKIQADHLGDGLAVPVIITGENVKERSIVAYNRAKELGVRVIDGEILREVGHTGLGRKLKEMIEEYF